MEKTGKPAAAGRRLAIVDDHEIFAEALAVWARDHLDRVEVVYAGPDPARIPDGVDLVLLDIDLGEGSRPAADVTADLVAAGGRVLLVSALGEASRIRPALVAGALGYVPKRAGGDTLHAAVESALRGEVYVSPDLAAVMMAADDTPNLSVQESTALRLYASGLTLESVARRMNVSPSTVREYLARVRRKYAEVGRQVRTKTDMYAAAIKDGFIEPRA
jgi:DNA-binding NarL/FixJ family response regulator